jgi:galactokinase
VLAQLVDMAEQIHGAHNIGFNGLFGGDLALGAGLSSSAALEVSSGLAIAKIYGLTEKLLHGESRFELAKICQMSEHVYVGVMVCAYRL